MFHSPPTDDAKDLLKEKFLGFGSLLDQLNFKVSPRLQYNRVWLSHGVSQILANWLGQV